MTPPKDITEGEWRFTTWPQPNGCPIIGNNQGVMVAMLAHSVNEEGQEATALDNARMMAASKELAEALNEACEILSAVLREDINEPEDEIAAPRDRFQSLLIKSGYTP